MNQSGFSSATPKKGKILIVDDSEMNRCMLQDILEDDYDIIMAENGVKAVAELKKESSDISLVMLDMVMPEMDGFDVLSVMNKYRWIESIPVIIISAENSQNYIERAYDLGVTDYIRRPFDSVSVRRRVINTINLYANQKRLVGIVADQLYEKEKTNSLMISILSHIVEFRNGESGAHVLNIHAITEALLNRYITRHPHSALRRSDISLISLASALHDIGKISIPDEVLNKPGRLTDEEFAIMKTHSMIGAQMIEALPYKDEPLVRAAYEICRWHHERFDGRGYPDGLKGSEIPISAQVVSVADVYDALTSERVYKKAFSHEKAMDMILAGECGNFNPEILECLKDIGASLKDDLGDTSDNIKSRKEVQNITEQMLRYDELKGTEQTLGLLENERIKYQFLASLSNDIQFDYIDEPSMLAISEWGAKAVGLPQNIIDPKSSDVLLSVFPPNAMKEFSAKVRSTTPEQPVTEFTCELKINGIVEQCKLVCRSMWTYSEDGAKYVGVVGKVIELQNYEMFNIDFDYMASHDPLTGLYNAHHARTTIETMLENNTSGKYALGMLSLEHFRTSGGDRLNQTLRDGALKFTAKKISAAVDEADVIARVNGNTFLVFVSYENDLNEKLNNILDPLTRKYESFSVCARLGAATTEKTGRSFDALYIDALRALKLLSGKESGSCLIYGEKIMPNGYEE